MITWIQSSMQRHHRWIFSVLLVIIIIAFVFTIGSLPTGQGDGSRKTDTFFGVNLNAAAEVGQYQTDIAYLFRLTGQPSVSQQTFQNIVFDRIALDSAANALDYPWPNQTEMMKFITSLPAFLKEDGTFDKVRFQSFLDSMEAAPVRERESLERALANNARAFLFTDIESGPGYVFPDEAKLMLVQQGAQYTLETAVIDLSKLDISVPADQAAQQAFFEAHKEQYRVPAKIQADLLIFPATAQAKAPTDAELEAYFIRNQKNWPDTTFAAAKEKVAAAYQQAMARNAAARAAVDFALAVQNGNIAPGSAEWNFLLEKGKVQTRATRALAVGEAIEGISLNPQELAEATNQLISSEARLFSDPISSDEGAIVLVRKDLIASHIPQYGEVIQQVAKDYEAYTRQQQIADKERALIAAVKKDIADGKTFAQAVAAQKVFTKVEKTDAFTMSTPPKDLPGIVLYVVQDTVQGELRIVPMRGADPIVVYVAQKVLPEIPDNDPKLEAMTAQLALMSARATQAAAMQQIVYNELLRVGAIQQEQR